MCPQHPWCQEQEPQPCLPSTAGSASPKYQRVPPAAITCECLLGRNCGKTAAARGRD